MSLGSSARHLTVSLGLATAWLLLFCGPAFAHAGIVEASPEYDETVPRPPEEVRLRFNERVEAEFDPVEVYGRGGERVDRGDARTDPDDPTVMVASLKEGLPAGAYKVEWRTTSADGHPIDGEYRFTAKAAGADEPRDEQANADDAGEQERQPGSREGPSSTEQNVSRVVIYGFLALGVVAAIGFALLRQR